MANKSQKIERLTLKLPSDIAEYFRKNFPHGKRSEFVADCLLKHKYDREVAQMEEKLRQVTKTRQK